MRPPKTGKKKPEHTVVGFSEDGPLSPEKDIKHSSCHTGTEMSCSMHGSLNPDQVHGSELHVETPEKSLIGDPVAIKSICGCTDREHNYFAKMLLVVKLKNRI